MTPEEVDKRLRMAVTCGVVDSEDVGEYLREIGCDIMVEPTPEQLLQTLNFLLDEQNVLTPAARDTTPL